MDYTTASQFLVELYLLKTLCKTVGSDLHKKERKLNGSVLTTQESHIHDDLHYPEANVNASSTLCSSILHSMAISVQ